jgi:hypothetical protein
MVPDSAGLVKQLESQENSPSGEEVFDIGVQYAIIMNQSKIDGGWSKSDFIM